MENVGTVVCVAGLGSLVTVSPAHATKSVVAATPELADITRSVGGNLVSVYSIAKPNQDYHMIEPRPSDVIRHTPQAHWENDAILPW